MIPLKSLLFSMGMLFMPMLLFGFTFTVMPGTETCSGNATLTFVPSDTTPGASIQYLIYKLPNTSVPYATTTALMISGLTAGDYRVVAVETVGSATTSQQQDVTIINAIVPLAFTVQSLNQACAMVSNISVTTTSGTAVSYEIFEGPVTFPSQTSNVFNNLPVGVYKIRVFDACGFGIVSTFTVTLNSTSLAIAAPVFGNTAPPSCNFIVVSQTITPATGTVMAYPLSIVYTVHPPGGAPFVIFSEVINSGDPLSQVISTTLPTYSNQDYSYDIVITDACNTITPGNFTVSQNIDLRPNIYSLACNDNFFELTASNFTPPYTFDFTSFPTGFNPVVFNAGYPGPFTAATITFGGSSLTAPLGSYTVTILDFCGKTKTITFEILDIPPTPDANATNDGCLTNTGAIVVEIPHYNIATAIIISAPASYPQTIPSDVSALIDTSGVLTLPSVPLGDYVIQLTDLCGSTISPVSVSIPGYINQPLLTEVRPGCTLGQSSLRIMSGNSAKLTVLTIDSAPAGFGFATPFIASSNITASGDFYMNNLPAGNYSITVIDECGFTNSVNIAISGYAIDNSNFALQTNCGTFDLDLDFVSNGTANETFWLQKLLNETSNTWGHPISEVVYNENAVPDATNSFPLANNATNFNLAFNGTFRIVRNFYSYNNGNDFNIGLVSTTDKSCIEILAPTFEFNESLEIVDAYRLPCSSSGSLDVVIEVNGPLPLHYTITEKDGVAFAFDNGTSNIFYNLEPGVYTFEVSDLCGNIVPRQFDVAALGSLMTITKPDDLLNCVPMITGNETFNFLALSPIILGNQSPAEYTLNYYTSVEDAQSGTNAISNLATFNPSSDVQTIYATVRFNLLPNCYEITSFDLYIGQTPQINLNATYLKCDTSPVMVDAAGNNLPTTTYEWSNGSTDSSVSISQSGVTNLTVTVTNTYGANLFCTASKEIEIVISVPPVIERIDTVDWTDEENTITIISATPEQFEYALNDGSFQSGNVFTNLKPGLYTVSIRDKFGCGTVKQQVWLLNYPKFFTPNGDGYHDLWYIENAVNEPDFKVFIFDRYGKLLKSFGSRDVGWDGIYNGREIFSEDYWFVVHRQDGRVFKGHFTLKR